MLLGNYDNKMYFPDKVMSELNGGDDSSYKATLAESRFDLICIVLRHKWLLPSNSILWCAG